MKIEKIRFKKPAKKQMIQIIAPVIIILVVFSLFIVYYAINGSKEPEQDRVEQGLITCEDLGCPENTLFIASKESNVYHECISSYAPMILPQNRVCFYTAQEAEDAGYRPAAK